MATITDKTILLAEFTHEEAKWLASALHHVLGDGNRGISREETLFLATLKADLTKYT